MLKYVSDNHDLQNWVFSETEFDTRFLGKCESVMCLGNGYLGLRSCIEEHYLGETRNLFIAGTFNRFDKNEVTELPNCADVTGIELEINGFPINLEKGKTENYSRTLNLKTGELIRSFEYETPETGKIKICFRRYVSLADLHIIEQRIEIMPLDQDVSVKLISGIDARMTNSGVQHFTDGIKRFYEGKVMQLVQTTTQSGIDIVFNLIHTFKGLHENEVSQRIGIERRRIFASFEFEIDKGTLFTIEKSATVHTSRDLEYLETGFELADICEKTRKELVVKTGRGYKTLLSESAAAWQELVWKNVDIRIDSKIQYDQLAVRFAIYHLICMTPRHDARMNIGAKGLSGEGYKGHSFWDTEIFILPFYTWVMPETARNLIRYRYLSLPGAREKAAENGYEGAMFPWESAWLDHGETTPVWGAADIVTGKASKIWTGFIEQHITSDVAFSVWQYYMITGDKDFMNRYGYELIFETARFWASRLEWDEETGLYHINDVIGPDEYKEHVNNDAFTNYTAHWTIGTAIRYYDTLKKEQQELFESLNRNLGLDAAYDLWNRCLRSIYLPQPNEAGILPQDDTYLTLPEIDLSKYKLQKHVGEIYKDYSQHQLSSFQVSKQADVLLLLYLFEDLFDMKVKKASWDYYEPKTLHDSSLSLSTHTIMACDLNNMEMAYELFRKASEIDLGPNMKSSDQGIHAASLGGIWQAVVCGFGGVRMLGGRLQINPHLPKDWYSMCFQIFWHGDRLSVEIDGKKLKINRTGYRDNGIEVLIGANVYTLIDSLVVEWGQ